MEAITNEIIDNMDDGVLTTASQNISPPPTKTQQELVVIEFVTNMQVVDVVVDTVLESTLGEGLSSPYLPQKRFQQIVYARQSKARGNSKELLQIKAKHEIV